MEPPKGRSARDALDRIEQSQERMARPIQGVRIGELHALTEEELVEKHDVLVEQAAKTHARHIEHKARILDRAQVYADELTRRESIRQGERMEALTRETISQGDRLEKLTQSLNSLTWAIAIATFVGVILTTLALILGG